MSPFDSGRDERADPQKVIPAKAGNPGGLGAGSSQYQGVEWFAIIRPGGGRQRRTLGGGVERGILRVEETKTGEPLELPLARQLAAVFESRRAEAGGRVEEGWVFPSLTSATGHLTALHRYHVDISRAAGTRFWFHGLRNAFITIAERDLMLPRPLTKRLVNHARDDDITEGYAVDWTIEQLREPAQRVADRIEALLGADARAPEAYPASR